MKAFLICALAVSAVFAEPPVPSNFGGSGGSQYGPPTGKQGGSGGFGSPSSNYGAPSSGPSSNYGTPSGRSQSQSSQYGAPAPSAPSSNYAAPSQGYQQQQGGQQQGYNDQQGQQQQQQGGGGYDNKNSGGHGDDGYGSGPPMPYNFAYAVKDLYGNDYNREETSDGNVVTGQYKVLLPDGRTQIVTYTADWKNGFNAQVTYEGEAKYPEPNANGGYGNQQGGQGGYNAPASGSAPQPTYNNNNNAAPQQSYGAPQQSYNNNNNNNNAAPKQSYGAPQQSYNAPQQSYNAPQQGYNSNSNNNAGQQQQQSYSAPQQSYNAPAPSSSYGSPAPASNFGRQNSQYNAPTPAKSSFGGGNPQQGGYNGNSGSIVQAQSFTPNQSYGSPQGQGQGGFGNRISQKQVSNGGYGKKK